MKCNLDCIKCKPGCSFKYYQASTLGSGEIKSTLHENKGITYLENNQRIKFEARRDFKNRGLPVNLGGGIPATIQTSHDKHREIIPDEQNTISDILNISSDYRFQQEKLDDAKKIDPHQAKALHDSGYQLEKQGQYEDAVRKYRQAIKVDPNFTQTYFYLGRLLAKLNQLEEAKITYLQAIMKNPNDADSLCSLGRLLRLEEKFEDAILLFEKSQHLKPCLPPLLNLAGIHRELGNHELVNQYVTKARKHILSDDWYNRACMESICGNIDDALELLRNAAQAQGFNSESAWRDPDLIWIRDHPTFNEITGLRSD
jgi:tetratricopeptide (TPR) repeat protein